MRQMSAAGGLTRQGEQGTVCKRHGGGVGTAQEICHRQAGSQRSLRVATMGLHDKIASTV